MEVRKRCQKTEERKDEEVKVRRKIDSLQKKKKENLENIRKKNRYECLK